MIPMRLQGSYSKGCELCSNCARDVSNAVAMAVYSRLTAYTPLQTHRNYNLSRPKPDH